MYQHGVKQTLRAGSIVFGLSALFLIIAPGIFLDLLGVTNNAEMIWSMRMIAITLVALAGNMWQNAKQNNTAGIAYVGRSCWSWLSNYLYSSQPYPFCNCICRNRLWIFYFISN
jgi:hypothetical protein